MRRAERERLLAACAELRIWAAAAQSVQWAESHLPVSTAAPLTADDRFLLGQMEQAARSGDIDNAVEAASISFLDIRSKVQPARDAADRVVRLYEWATDVGAERRLEAVTARVAAVAQGERSELRTVLDRLAHTASRSVELLDDERHLAVTPPPATSTAMRTAAQSLIQVVSERLHLARPLTGEGCIDQSCSLAHDAARFLVEVHREACQDALLDQLEKEATRLGTQRQQEHSRLAAVLVELDGWAGTARATLTGSLHLPITRRDPLAPQERAALENVGAVIDEHHAQVRLLLEGTACAREECAGLHPSGAALAGAHTRACSDGTAEVLVRVPARINALRAQELQVATAVLTEVRGWEKSSQQALGLVTHLPLTRSGAVPEPDLVHLQLALDMSAQYLWAANHVLDGNLCDAGECELGHQALNTLMEYHAEAVQSGAEDAIVTTAPRLLAVTHRERAKVAVLLEEARSWPRRVKAIRHVRAEAEKTVAARTAQLLKEARTVKVEGRAMKLFPLKEVDGYLVAHLIVLRDHVLTPAEEAGLDAALSSAVVVTEAAAAGLTETLECRPGTECATAHDVISQAYQRSNEIEAELDRLTIDRSTLPMDADRLLDPDLRLIRHLGSRFHAPEPLPGYLLAKLATHSGRVLHSEEAVNEAVLVARAAADKVRSNDVVRALRAMDLEVLRKASQEPIRIAPLEGYDLHNVWDVYKFQSEYLLESLSGLGDSSARAITRAVIRLFEAVRDETPVRIDVRRKGKRTEALLVALAAWDRARRFVPTAAEVEVTQALATMAAKGTSLDRVVALTVERDGSEPIDLQPVCEGLVDRLPLQDDVGDLDIWTDFLTRPADYFGMLSELGFVTEDEAKMHGDLPDEIVEAVRAKELRRDHLTASLRAYQAFGARFALVQEKVVIGDEMGLGKTVEALAVFTHLRATGQTHFLVVCPAAVVSNWIRETAKHTLLTASRLHGTLWEREHAAKAWVGNGGVAVTTYDLLPWAQGLMRKVDVGAAVFDEAHYIKNPLARRSLAAAEVIDSVRYVVLMTGTPLENSVREFRNLIGYLRPDLSESAPEYLASKFRKHVAPAYLRRNQEDVLSELPELVEVEEWLGMSPEDERVYRAAVQEGQFMLMRRAAMLSERSLKVERLAEIVGEAESNGRRVIVFSYFREVLDQVAAMIPGEVFGPLTGSVPAAKRQALVDQFSDAGDGAVLVAQISAGGVGLNIQSASVVVICEPQLKPTTEAQAVARAHRMGQTTTVQVHRLLSENSVDERIRELLAEKRELFDDFARDSVIARQAPEAVDVTDAELARLVVQAERERLFASE